MKRRILLADDHQMFREALRLLLERHPDINVVGETGDGRAVLALASATRPDIVCLDIDLPGANGVEVARQLGAALPDIRIVALSSYVDRHYVKDMLNAGARAYVTKTGGGNELLRAIEAVGQDRAYLCPEAAEAIREEMSTPNTEPRLGARELQVLKLVALGHTSARIAEQLDIAQSTVEVHRRNIMRKLGVDSAVGLTRYALKHRLVPGE